MLKNLYNPTAWEKILKPCLLVQSVLVGLIVGVFVVIFKLSVESSFGVLQKNIVSGEYPFDWLWIPLVTTLGGALAGWLIFRFAPETSGSGIPYIKAVLSRVGLIVRMRSIVIKFLAGVAGIGTGMPLGREGPSVQLGAGAGAMVAKIFNRQGTHSDGLVAAGSGAALGAVFNAPIAGTIFVFEELLHKFSPVILFPVLVSTVTAAAVMRFFLGNHPSFEIPDLSAAIGWHSLVVCLFLGIITGILAVGFSWLIVYFRKLFSSKKTFPQWSKPAIAGLVVGVVGCFLPLAMGAGNEAIELLLYHHLSGKVIIGLLIIRFILTPFCFGSGAAGGIFLPMLMIGAFIGYLTALGADSLNLDVDYVVIALAGMSAFMAAVVRTPITAVVMIFEMTGGYGYILPIMLATAAADFVAARLGHEPIYTILQYNYMEQSSRAQALASIKADSVMTKTFASVREGMFLSEIKVKLEQEDRDVFPVLNEHKQLKGVVFAKDIYDAMVEEKSDSLKVEDIMNPYPLTVSSENTLYKIYFELHDKGEKWAFIVDKEDVLQGIMQSKDISRYIL